MSKGKLRSLKKRIDSTNSTMQITRAMEMVARAKVRKVERNLEFVRDYEKALDETLAKVMDASDEVLAQNGSGDVLLVITADMGLCGSFNGEILRLADSVVKEGNVKAIVTVGQKAENFFKGSELLAVSRSRFYEIPDSDEAAVIADDVLDIMHEKGANGFQIVYSHFKNPIAQIARKTRVLPYSPGEVKENDLYDFEPIPEELLKNILDSWIISKVLLAAHETKVGETFARMNSMGNATENAKKMIESLTLSRNKVRQANITNEILEVVNGAEALKA